MNKLAFAANVNIDMCIPDCCCMRTVRCLSIFDMFSCSKKKTPHR